MLAWMKKSLQAMDFPQTQYRHQYLWGLLLVSCVLIRILEQQLVSLSLSLSLFLVFNLCSADARKRNRKNFHENSCCDFQKVFFFGRNPGGLPPWNYHHRVVEKGAGYKGVSLSLTTKV